MPRTAKRRSPHAGLDPNLTLELRTHARVFGHMSLYGGLAAFLAGREAELDSIADGNADPIRADDRERAFRVLTRAFGNTPIGQAYRAHALAVDAASMLRRMIASTARSALCLPVIASKLRALRDCMLQAADRPGKHATVDDTVFEPAIQAVHAAVVCEIVSKFEGTGRVAVFVTAVKRVNCDSVSVLPEEFEKTFSLSANLRMVDINKSPYLIDSITKLCKQHTADAAVESVRTLLDELKLDHMWHAQMDQLEKDLEAGQVVRMEDVIAKGQQLIKSGTFHVSPGSPPRGPKKGTGRNPNPSAAKLALSTRDRGGKGKATVQAKKLNVAGDSVEVIAVQAAKKSVVSERTRPQYSAEANDAEVRRHGQASGRIATTEKQATEEQRGSKTKLNSNQSDSVKDVAASKAVPLRGKRAQENVAIGSESEHKLPERPLRPKSRRRAEPRLSNRSKKVALESDSDSNLVDVDSKETHDEVEPDSIRRSPRISKQLPQAKSKDLRVSETPSVLVISDSEEEREIETEKDTGSDYVQNMQEGEEEEEEDDEDESLVKQAEEVPDPLQKAVTTPKRVLPKRGQSRRGEQKLPAPRKKNVGATRKTRRSLEHDFANASSPMAAKKQSRSRDLDDIDDELYNDEYYRANQTPPRSAQRQSRLRRMKLREVDAEDDDDVIDTLPRQRKKWGKQRTSKERNAGYDDEEIDEARIIRQDRKWRAVRKTDVMETSEDEIVAVPKHGAGRKSRAQRLVERSDDDASEAIEVPRGQSSRKRRGLRSEGALNTKRRRFTIPPDTTTAEDSGLEGLTEEQKYMIKIYAGGERGDIRNGVGGPQPRNYRSTSRGRSRKQSAVLDRLPIDAMERYDHSLVVNDVGSVRRNRRRRRRS